jgi:hypothetical protein
MLSKKALTVFFCAALIMSLTGQLMAQDTGDSAQMALDYSKVLEANTKALQAFSWNERSEVTMEGEEVVVILRLIRFSEGGEFQATLLSQQPEKPGGKGPKNKKAQKIYDGAVGAAQSIPQLLMSYTMLSSGQLVDFFGNGKMSPGEGDMAGTTKIAGANVLQKGDSVTLYLDPTTLTPKGMDVKTVANDQAIEAYLDFALLEDGTSYLSKADSTIPEKGMEIKFETFDHKK